MKMADATSMPSTVQRPLHAASHTTAAQRTARSRTRQSARESRAAKGPLHGEPSWWFASPLAARHREALRDGINARGFAVLDNVLSQTEALGLRGCLKMLFNRFGCQDKSETHNMGIRSDAIQALNEHIANAEGLGALASALKLLKGFGHELAHIFDPTLTVARNAQVACYALPGSRYKRHGDNLYNPSQDDTAPSGFTNWRAFTVILYCNADWAPEHGGCLRMYADGGAPPPVARIHDPVPPATLHAVQRYTDIEPLAGRLVAFNSLIHHEVLPAWQPRFATTLWIWKEDGEAVKFARS
jgi:SM-20-related protein